MPHHPFTMQEAQNAISKLKCGKMPGMDGTTAELAKVFPQIFAQSAVSNGNTALASCTWPPDWATARGHAIPKSSATAHTSDPKDFRLIAALPTEAKIVTYMLLRRLKQHLGAHIPHQQTGFMPAARVDAAVSGTAAFLEKANLRRLPVLATTVDIRKAFDTVDRGILLAKLEEARLPWRLLFLLRSYLNQTQVVLPNGTIKYRRGVVQGCVLSPLLFAFYMSEVARSAEPNDDGDTPALLLSGDDILLLSTDPLQHAQSLRSLASATARLNLEIHPDKCRTLVIGQRQAHRDDAWVALQQGMHQDIAPLFSEQCQQMRYLGYTLSSSGLQPGDEDLSKTALGMAQRIRSISLQSGMGSRHVANICKTYLLPLLDWGHAVPCKPGPDNSNWVRSDAEADAVVAAAVSGPLFGPLTQKHRKIPFEVVCDAIGIKPAQQRRAQLAKGLENHLSKLPATHPTSRCLALPSVEQDATPHAFANWLNMRAHLTPSHSHSSTKAWGRSRAVHGNSAKMMQAISDPDLRRACLKMRSNTNTFLPGDAIRMVHPWQTECTQPACAGCADTLRHKFLDCPQPRAAALRAAATGKIKQLLFSQEPTPNNASLFTNSILREAAYGNLAGVAQACAGAVSPNFAPQDAPIACATIALASVHTLLMIARDSPQQLGLPPRRLASQQHSDALNSGHRLLARRNTTPG